MFISPVACLGDFVACLGPCAPGFIVATFQYTVFIGNRPAACVGDLCNNCCIGAPGCWCPRPIITGSYTTFIGNRPVARVGDLTPQGIILTGSLDTFIGS